MRLKHDFSKLKTHDIRGKSYRLHWKRPRPKDAGACDHPTTQGKGLWIHPDNDEMELWDTVVHEVTHGAFPDLDEDSVLEFTRDLRRLLTRMRMKITFEPI